MKYDAKLLAKMALIFFGLLFLVCIWLGRRQQVRKALEGDKISVEDVEILLEALDIHSSIGTVAELTGKETADPNKKEKNDTESNDAEKSVVDQNAANAGTLGQTESNLTYAQYIELYRELHWESMGVPDYEERYEPEHEMLRADWYEAYRILLAHLDTESSIWETTVFLLKTDSEAGEAYTQNSGGQTPYRYLSSEFERNVFREMKAYINGSQLLTIVEVLSGEHELKNVWVTESTEGVLQCFYRQTVFQVEAEHPAERERIADLTFRDGKVVDTKEKKEKVHGKLLWISEKELEIEGEGVYPIGEEMEVYKLYGSLESLTRKDLKIGYADTDYVIEKGKVCACLVSQAEKADRIRVLLKNTAKGSNYYDAVEMEVDGEKIKIKADDLAAGERRTYQCNALTDKITLRIDGIEKQDNAYRGVIECYRNEEGLVLINELPLEEYLYAVVPSEMPASYPPEALKAQAVCARTYAYLYILHAGLPELGAHVDDTTTYQVYHNSSENAATTTAVKETDGMLLTYQGNPAQNYYYSTSCGVGTDAGVWKSGQGEELSYIKAIRMNEEAFQYAKEDSGSQSIGTVEQEGNAGIVDGLREEENFRKFITSVDDTDLEKEESWYRWKYTVENIDTKAMLSRIMKRYQSSPESVLTRTEGDYYVSQPIEKLGKILELSITRRGPGGVADELLIKTDTGTYKILAEYNIRSVLCDGVSEAIKQDGSTVVPGSLLPSGFFVIDSGKMEKSVIGYTLIGGGYGHGVGMSQNGARALGERGASYQEILEFYFSGCRVETVSAEEK